MNKRSFLKILAFLAGLYFVLEFFLPEKVGGDFDSYAVQSPAPVETSAGLRLFYTGLYANRITSVACLAPPRGEGPWTLVPGGPLLTRSPLVSDDLGGMDQLASVAGPHGPELFYLGTGPAQDITLCRASGNPDATKLSRQTPPHFLPRGPRPLPRTQIPVGPNGALPGVLTGFAVDRSGSDWTLLLLLTAPGQGLSVWRATGPELAALPLDAAPICAAGRIPAGTTAFDARRSGTGWTLFFAAENQLITLTLDDTGSVTAGAPRELATPGTRITGLRVTGDRLFAATARDRTPIPPREFAPFDSQLVVAPLNAPGAPVVIRKPGTPPAPTYLTRGIGTAGTFLQILVATALLIPVINLSLFHGKKIARRTKGWPNSGIFFVCLVGMFVVTLVGKGSVGSQAHSAAWSHAYTFLFSSIVQAMGTAVFSLIAFYMISAAYRSFRVRSLEAVLLMTAACIVMVGQMPLGELQAAQLPPSLGWLGLPWLSQKLLTLVNACAYRGVLLGLTIGGLSIAIRIWLGLDNSVYSGLEGKPK